MIRIGLLAKYVEEPNVGLWAVYLWWLQQPKLRQLTCILTWQVSKTPHWLEELCEVSAECAMNFETLVDAYGLHYDSRIGRSSVE